jgi:two-component system, NtrC family, sensor histidine kinase HydH
VFAENVEAIYSAGRIQDATWRALTSAYEGRNEHPLASRVLAATIDTFERELPKLRRLSLTEAETISMGELDRQFLDLKVLLSSLSAKGSESGAGRQTVLLMQLSELTNAIASTTDRLRDINQKLASDLNRARDESTSTVFAIRTSILIFGPALGIAYGWWMARRLQRSVARITVILGDATAGNRTLGAVNIDELQALDAIESQVGHVVTRLNQANDELKQARDEILRSERLAAVGELAAGVAHELRNPLTSVKLLLQHAAKQGHSELLTETKLQLILDEIARMESTIQGLLDFSRPPRLNRVLHDVRVSLRRAMNLVAGRAQQQHIQILEELSDEQLMVNADPEQLHQVFVNLLLNGLESMPDGGNLTLHAEPQDGRNSIQVRVRDNGTGIPDEIMKRLFEPFATSKDRGTGLGLAVSRRIVIDHRGTITASNCQTGGAVFQVTLPAA